MSRKRVFNDILEFYANIGLGGNITVCKAPPERNPSFEEILKSDQIGTLTRDSIRHYFNEHLPYLRESISRFGVEGAFEKFETLFHLGILDFQITFHFGKARVDLLVWNGQEYELCDDLLKRSSDNDDEPTYEGDQGSPKLGG